MKMGTFLIKRFCFLIIPITQFEGFQENKLKIRLKSIFAISDKFNNIHAVGNFVQSLNNSANCSMAARLIMDKNHRYMNLLGLESKLTEQKMRLGMSDSMHAVSVRLVWPI